MLIEPPVISATNEIGLKSITGIAVTCTFDCCVLFKKYKHTHPDLRLTKSAIC